MAETSRSDIETAAAEFIHLREKRRYVRVEGKLSVTYSLVPAPSSVPMATAVLTSLSVGGARILAREEVEVGAELRLDMPIPSMTEPSSAIARVVRSEPFGEPGYWQICLEFVRIEINDLRRIADFVDERREVERSTLESLALRADLLQHLAQILHVTLDPERILGTVLDLALELTDAESGSVLLLNPATDRLEFTVARGPRAESVRPYTLALGEGIAGWVALHGRPLNVASPQQDERWRRDIAESIDYKTSCVLAVPLALKDHTFGVIEVLNRRSGERFSTSDIRILESLGSQAAVVLENARVYRRLQQEAHEALEQSQRLSERLAMWRRAAETNLTQAVIVAPLDGEDIWFNDPALELIANLGTIGPDIETRLKQIVENVRLVAPIATRSSATHLVAAEGHAMPVLLAHVGMLRDDSGIKRGIAVHLLDMGASAG